MQNEFLQIDKENDSVIYLGYPLKLTRRELKVLNLIADSEGGISSQELLAALSTKKSIGIGNVAVQVFNINQKAKKIGGRSIIVERRTEGYMLAEYL